jgi:hypothetical protein
VPNLRSIPHAHQWRQDPSASRTVRTDMTGALAIDFRAARQICCRGRVVAQPTLLGRTAAIAILEAALKQMHVCALLHRCEWPLTHQHNMAGPATNPVQGFRALRAVYWEFLTSTTTPTEESKSNSHVKIYH